MYKTILVVDDEESICQSLRGILSDEGYEVRTAGSGEDALKAIEEDVPDLVLLDIWLPGMDGLEALKIIKAETPQVPVIMMSGHGTIETAVKATKLGAFDFIEKPISLEKVVLLVNHALALVRLEEENRILKQKVTSAYELIGRSRTILELKEMIRIVAPTNAWILIMGENGTGKELVARSIHYQSKRARRPFIEVNCAAIPEELIESELFGHEKGSFTGATAKKRGKFELAHEGTLFLDEVADMSLKAQAKILRILQEKKFERVGGNKFIDTDVRVLAATNKDLEKEMEAERFRQDLYYRLNVIPLTIAPLRDRKEDIPILAAQFVNDFCVKEGVEPKAISDDAIEVFMEHSWPGNVRELKNIMERLVIMTQGAEITADDIPPLSKEVQTGEAMDTIFTYNSFRKAKMEFEKKFIMKKLQENEGNISKTADSIGLERSNLHRKIKTHSLEAKKD
ncbi:MAG: sigma-54 dependent transcriptional regulator [Pseudomonadota bacterium]|jgi:two-component system nitrogen regulation response regulator NtrX|nr:sigma-54-dependent Fis family transcriptional regulator [Syntrophobacterales bacterium]MDI9556126.1 sigma-54 dependent transcriptional regulator [Pseudomonadota bacterium]NLX31190.1 sigma-54-dependent Fis family transcriptional regulator [Deltaproteobacteria bacterium]HNU85814.1 sigma-54 dependent transcriptional regulator [Syntrophales bacterium]HNZ35010.1 sigma-54 dependent transcriptional regulator [Syntrophales bacterium]